MKNKRRTINSFGKTTKNLKNMKKVSKTKHTNKFRNYKPQNNYKLTDSKRKWNKSFTICNLPLTEKMKATPINSKKYSLKSHNK